MKRKFHGESSNNQVEDEDPAKGMKSLASFFGSKAQKGDNGASVDTKGRCPDPSFVKSDIEPLQVKKDEDRTVIADSMSVILLEQVCIVYSLCCKFSVATRVSVCFHSQRDVSLHTWYEGVGAWGHQHNKGAWFVINMKLHSEGRP